MHAFTIRHCQDFLKIATLSIIALFSHASAQYDSQTYGLDQEESNESKVTAALLSEYSAVEPGQTFTVALELKHKPHWHTYWRNSGGISESAYIDWELPEGWTAGDIQWPSPGIYESSGVKGYGYEDTVYLLADITAPQDANTGDTVKIVANAGWQACNIDSCIPDSAELSLELTIGEPTTDESQAQIIDKAREEIPVQTDNWEFSFNRENGTLIISLNSLSESNPELEDVRFYPYDNFARLDATQELTKIEQGYQLTVPLFAEEDKSNIQLAAESVPDTIRGILVSENGFAPDGSNKSVFVHPEELEPGEANKENSEADSPAIETAPENLLLVLLGALVGGLILNLMPCVFPVIGLKIMGFVSQAGDDRKKIAAHGIIFTVGVLISYWILAGIVIATKKAVEAKGGKFTGTWGDQMQDPMFVYIIILVIFALSLSLAGVFELGSSATGVGGKLTRKSGVIGTFFSGVLATIIATPCAAPILGAPLAAAFVAPTATSLLIFTVIGIGLALPYLFLSFFPQLVEKLPKPGPWMETFKHLVGFIMFAVVAYFVWNYEGLVDSIFLLRLLYGLVIIALAAYVYGRWGTIAQSKKTRYIAFAFTLMLAVGAIVYSHPKDGGLIAVEDGTSVPWQKWSPEKTEELLAEGHTVFIDFTARWCPTCLTNKATYENDKEVVELMKRKDVIPLKADYTKRDPEIAKALAEYNRRAIPVNVIYKPGDKEPYFLDTAFLPGYLKKELEKLPDAE